MPYIDMDFEDALRTKWEAGIRKHRKPGQHTFKGDASEELYEELLDCLHYVSVLEQDGVELPGFHTTFKNMALTLQQRRRELKKRI